MQVAGDVDSVSYGSNSSITDWVGFGDAVDVFKIRLEDIAEDDMTSNGQVIFKGADSGLKLLLVDANGKSVALTYDKESGDYISKNVLMAGVDYYLTVKNSDEKKQNIDYNIDITLA